MWVWSISEVQKSSRDGPETSITSVQGMSKLVKSQPDQEMMRGSGGVTEVKEPTGGTETVYGDCLRDVSSSTRTGGHQVKLAGDRFKTSKKRCFFAWCVAGLWKLFL